MKTFLNCQFFSKGSIQLGGIHWHRKRSLLLACWSILLFGLAEYMLLSETFFEADFKEMRRQMEVVFHLKPLFRHFYFLLLNSFRSAQVLIRLHFLTINLGSNRLMECLDNLQNRASNESKTAAKRKAFYAFLAIIIAEQTIFIAALPPFFQKMGAKLFSFKTLTLASVGQFALVYASMFILDQSVTIVLGTVFYYQICTWRSLIRLQKLGNFSHFQKELRRLALLSRQLNALLTFPFAYFLYVCTLDVVIVVSAVVHRIPVDNYLFLVVIVGSFCLVAWASELVKGELIKIERSLKDRVFMSDGKDCSLAIRRYECVALYRDYFRLKLFSAVTFDFSFLLNCFTFICSYIVLLTQTNA